MGIEIIDTQLEFLNTQLKKNQWVFTQLTQKLICSSVTFTVNMFLFSFRRHDRSIIKPTKSKRDIWEKKRMSLKSINTVDLDLLSILV